MDRKEYLRKERQKKKVKRALSGDTGVGASSPYFAMGIEIFMVIVWGIMCVISLVDLISLPMPRTEVIFAVELVGTIIFAVKLIYDLRR